ncbi:Fc.00g009580.m01.CDS01 [Cosmosporella sp. VM-42]
MSPTRVGLVGLSPNGATTTQLSNWGVLAHMKPILHSPKYELVAVCNSSVESARKSIAFHRLPDTVKAYGSPEDLANDPNVDLVVVSVNVGKHFILTKPALLKNKQVIVEWPLGASLQEAEELTQLAKQQGVKTAVGLQFRADPLIAKVKKLVEGGSIGKITSSVAWGCSSVLPADVWIAEATYYLDMKSGGNEYNIYFGHFLDAFTSVLGDFETIQSTLKNHNPTVTTVKMATGEVVDTAFPKSAPDHTFIQGVLESGAVASITFRKAKKPVDGLGLRWLITGTEGEIEVTLPEDHLQMGPEGRALRLRIKDGDVQKVEFATAEPDHIQKVAYPGTNSARIYEQFAQGTGDIADFEAALKTHKLLDRIARDAKYI